MNRNVAQVVKREAEHRFGERAARRAIDENAGERPTPLPALRAFGVMVRNRHASPLP